MFLGSLRAGQGLVRRGSRGFRGFPSAAQLPQSLGLPTSEFFPSCLLESAGVAELLAMQGAPRQGSEAPRLSA